MDCQSFARQSNKVMAASNIATAIFATDIPMQMTDVC